jgi:hypothetical protein
MRNSRLFLADKRVISEKIGELKGLTEQRKRKKRSTDQKILDLNEKNEYTYKLLNKASGMAFAEESVDVAFASWSSAIGSAVTFKKTVNNLAPFLSRQGPTDTTSVL